MSEDKTEVTVPKSELDAIIAQNAELIALVKSQNDGKGIDAANSINVKKERLVTIATVDGMPVVGMVNKGTRMRRGTHGLKWTLVNQTGRFCYVT